MKLRTQDEEGPLHFCSSSFAIFASISKVLLDGFRIESGFMEVRSCAAAWSRRAEALDV